MTLSLLGWLDRPPPGVAFVDVSAGRTWTYADLATEVRRRAGLLASPRKAVVACICRPDARTAIAYLAALAAGHAVMMLDATADNAAVDALVRTYQAEFVLDGDSHERLHADAGPVAEDLAVLLSTSGSTATPKYVRLSWAGINANAAQIVEFLGIDGDERAVQALPLHYSYGLSVLNSHLLAGATVVFPGTSVVRPRFWEVMREQACTSFAGVPYTYTMLTRIGFEDVALPDLRTLTQAGGRMSPDAVLHFGRLMAGRGGRLFVMYGQTEATARIAYVPPHRVLDKPASVGVPVPGGRLSLAADGELVYEGPNVMLGYARGRSDLALGDVNHGRLATGDLGRIDEEGFCSIVGRKRRIAKLSGQRVNLDELETLLATHGRVAAVEVAGQLVLARAESDGATPGPDLLRHARDLVRIPTSFIRVLDIDQLPLTSAGKTDYARLMDELG